MAYRYGNRNQLTLLPPSIEDYVGTEDPVRAYDAFVEALDFNELGIIINPDKVGNPSYDPKSMLKLLIYGYSYGIRSSRKLERENKHNLSFIWLTGGIIPDHKTIAEFRKNNKEALRKVLKQCVRICIDLDLIEGNTIFVDSTRIRANASLKNGWTKERCQEALKTIDERIEKILSECEATDIEEENSPSLVTMKEELQNKETLKLKIQNIIKELKENNKKSINTIDADSNRMMTHQGCYAGYNAQGVVDQKHGLIVHSDVVSDNNDCKQFAKQVNQANEIMQKKCLLACADSGYADTPQLEKIATQDITVIVPSRTQASKEIKPFAKKDFRYDKDKDCYLCPKGNVLNYSTTNKEGDKIYLILKRACKQCEHFGICTKRKEGRIISRLKDEELKEKFEALYQQLHSQEIYKLRKQKVELPFAHIKRNLGVSAFLLRGLKGVRAEMHLLASCFNISRMITILGVRTIIATLAP
jgi:transposase